MTASEAGYDTADASWHMRRAVRSMEGNIARNKEDNVRRPRFCEEHLEKCETLLSRMTRLVQELANLSQELRMLG